jgi:ectoine hydroxylase-related dioxygenase (phytanoyl-CoA dioxygenase family)
MTVGGAAEELVYCEVDQAAGLERDGFHILPAVLDAAAVSALITSVASTAEADRGDARRQKCDRLYAMRNLLALVPQVRRLAGSPVIRALVDVFLGPTPRCVRGLLFDKTPGANWKVAWHQDLSIAVKRRADVPGFGPWSAKAGVPHVQPPVEVLENMLTVRLHLDDCGPDNGPLNVLPGSYVAGVLGPAAVTEWRRRVPPTACHVPAGGALLMRPLLLHASSPARAPYHRRVIHLEYAGVDLPGGLEWYEE